MKLNKATIQHHLFLLLPCFFIIIFFSSCSVFKSYKYEKRDYWVKHEYEQLHYIDTSKLERKCTEHIINAAIARNVEDYALAIIEYNLALRYDTTAAILYSIADCFGYLGKFDYSIIYGVAALKEEPYFLPAYDLLCKAYLNTYDLKNAIITLENAISMDENEERLFYLAQIYEHQKSNKAQEYYLRLVKEYNNSEALAKLVNAHRNAPNDNTDDTQYTELIQKLWLEHPDNFQLTLEIVSLWFATGDSDVFFKNLDFIDKSLTIDDLEDIYGYVFNQIFIIQDEQKASKNVNNTEKKPQKNQSIDDFNDTTSVSNSNYYNLISKIDKRFDSSAISNYNAELLALILNDTGLAADYLHRIVNIYPANDMLKIRCASLFHNFGYKNKTKSLLTQYSIEDNENWLYPYWLGNIEKQEHNYQDALNYFLMADHLDTANLQVLAEIADTYNSLGDFFKSDSIYEMILLDDPINPLVCNNYAFALSNRNVNLQRALELSQISLQYDSTSPEYLDTHGWIKFKLGIYDDAIELLELSVSYNPYNTEAYEHLSDIYYKLKNYEECNKLIDKALQLEPDNSSLKEKKIKYGQKERH